MIKLPMNANNIKVSKIENGLNGQVQRINTYKLSFMIETR